MVVTKDTIIGDILDEDFDAAPYFLDMGMHCLGCPASRGETIAEAWYTVSSRTSWSISSMHFLKRSKKAGLRSKRSPLFM